MISIAHSLKQIIRLSMPIIMGQLGQMLIVAGDVYIATMYSTKSVAAIGVAGGIINPIFLFGIGMTMGVSPSFAFMRGKGEQVEQHMGSVFTYSLLLGILLTLLMLALIPVIDYMGIESALVPSIKAYIKVVAWSFPLALVFGGLREFLQSFEEVFIPNLMAMVAVVLNLAINYILVFGMGNWGGWGEIGLAYASLGVRFILFVAIVIYTFSRFKFSFADFSVIKVLAKFSWPIAFMFFLEVMAFCTVTILSGKLGVVPAATNNIVMTLASLAFMIPLSISSAAAVKIGHAYGSRAIGTLKMHFKAVILFTLSFAIFSILIFMLLPAPIMGLITKDQAVIELGISLLFIVAIFQVFDAFQVSLAGALRGLGETRFPSIMVFIGYWVLGLPLGVYLTFGLNYGTAGLWIGLASSLAMVALSLGIFTYYKLKKLV